MKKIIPLMQTLGFTQYESQVYLALLQNPSVSGYELAKVSGVPASKIYATLHKLIDKEIILAIDGDPKKYVPIPPEEILKRIKDDYLSAIDDLQPKLEHLYRQDAEVGNYIWNLSGRALIISKIREFITKAQSKIYLSIWDEEIDALADALRLAAQRNVFMQIVHFGRKVLHLGQEYRHGREHQIRVERGGRRIALIVDDQYVILGHFLEDGSSSALWTTNKGLVLLAKDYIIHDIYSIKIIEKFGREANRIFETL